MCDATFESGSGHVMRQITLGAALKSVGLNPILFCFSIPDSLIARAHDFGLTVEKRSQRSDSSKLAEEVIATNCPIVVFDGYQFPREVITNVFIRNVQVVLIDDNGDLADFPCHLILNQNLHAKSTMYARNETSPQLLLGLSWALIRPEVVAQINSVADTDKSGIFLSIGGTDHLGITPRLLEELKQTFNEEIIATTGVLNSATLSPNEMALAMARARVGIIACGTTTWEAVCLSLPFVGLVTAENQVGIGDSLVGLSTTQIVDCRSVVDIPRIIESIQQLMSIFLTKSERSTPLVDGNGALRSAQKVLGLIH